MENECFKTLVLEKTTSELHKKLKFNGKLNYHLIESVLVEELSEQCIVTSWKGRK